MWTNSDSTVRLAKTAGAADCYSKTVKRKRTPAARAIPEPMLPESVIPEKLLEEAKRSIQSDRVHMMVLCSVCGSDCAPNSAGFRFADARAGMTDRRPACG